MLVIIIIIINFLCTIAEEVIFSFIYSYFSLQDKIAKYGYIDDYDDYDDYDDSIDYYDDYIDDDDYMDYGQNTPSQADAEKILKLQKRLVKVEKTFVKIMNKIGDDKEPDYGNNPDKKIKLLKIIPWICLNFNLLIQIITFIIIIIVKQRITLKNDFGSSSYPNNISSRQNQIGNNINSGVIYNVNNNEQRRSVNKKKSKNKKNNKSKNHELESGKINIVSKRASSKSHSRKKKK